MKINSILSRNLQGKSTVDRLAPVTAIAGPNFRGKTTRVNAVMLALAGYVPGVAKKPNEVFERLASGNPLEVQADLDDGRTLLRTWDERRGSVSLRSSDDAKAFEFPPVAIDPSEFFGLSGPERTRFLFARSDARDLTVSAIAATVCANLKNIKLEEGNTPATEDAICALSSFTSTSATTGAKQQPQEWLSDLVTSFKEKRLLAEQNAKRLEAGLASLTQTAVAASAPADAEQKLAQARRALDEANAEVGRLNEKVRQLEEQASSLRRASTGSVDEAEATARIREIEEQRQEELAVPRPPTEDKMEVVASVKDIADLATLSNEKERLFKAVTARPTAKVLQEPRPTDADARAALMVAEENLRKASDELSTATLSMKELERALDEATRQTTCPTCGHDIADKQKAVIADLRRRLDVATGVHVSKTSVHAICVGNGSDAAHALVQSAQAIATWDESKSSIDRQNQADLDQWNAANDGYRAASQAHADLQDKIAKATRAHWAKLNDEYVAAQQRATRLAGEAEALRAKMGDRTAADALARLPGAEQDLQRAKEDYKAAAEEAIRRKEAVRAADGDVAKLTQQRADSASRARAQEAAQAARAEHAVSKLACEMLGELQAAIVDKAVGPLLERCNRLCSGILEVPLAFDGGELGMRRQTGFVNWRTMSGSERALAYCAVSLALAVGSPIKLVVLDELGRIDRRNKRQLVTNLLRMVADGSIDQALLIDTDPADYEQFAIDPGFSLIAL